MKRLPFLGILVAAALSAGGLLAQEAKQPETLEAWKARRLAALVRPDGWLALIGRHPLEHGTWTVGSGADNAIRLAAGPEYLGEITYTEQGKVLFTVGPDVPATIDGVKRTEATNFAIGEKAFGYEGSWSTGELDYKSDNPTYVRAGTVNFHIMERGGKLFLRVRDSQSPRLQHFAGLDYFPVDPAWRIEADWIPFDPPRVVKVTNIIGLTEPADVPGKAVFTVDGKTYSLIPFDEGPESRLFFVLTDSTAGTETYEACRFLYANRPVNGKIILDFNQLYNPPCAFTPFATCPLPPKENMLPFPLRAGEMKYRGEH
jgi:uncharacterized protein